MPPTDLGRSIFMSAADRERFVRETQELSADNGYARYAGMRVVEDRNLRPGQAFFISNPSPSYPWIQTGRLEIGRAERTFELRELLDDPAVYNNPLHTDPSYDPVENLRFPPFGPCGLVPGRVHSDHAHRNEEIGTMARRQEVVAAAGASVPVNNLQKNFFEQYGEQASARTSIVGQLLKFSKGDWLMGQDEEDVPAGTRYAASMANLLVGWVKWVDNKPAEQIMGRIVDGHRPPNRDTLGDTDKEQWELDTNGKPRDPWQFSNQILFKPVGKKYSLDNAITFVTSSKGGIGAVGELCKAYGKEIRTKDGQNPIVELDTDSYQHSNKEFGRIKVPVIKLVGWESEKLFDVAAAEADAAAEQPTNGKKKR